MMPDNVQMRPRFVRGDAVTIPLVSVVVAAMLIGGRGIGAWLTGATSLQPTLADSLRLLVYSFGAVLALAVLQSRTIGSRAYVVVATLLVPISGLTVAIVDGPDLDAALWIKAGVTALAMGVAAVWLYARRRN